MNITTPIKFEKASDLDANKLNLKFREISEVIYHSNLYNEFCIPYIFVNGSEFNPEELYANLDEILIAFIKILYKGEKIRRKEGKTGK